MRTGTRWTAYAAAVCAFAFAAVSLYWALGGRAGVDTLAGVIAERARAGDPLLLVLNGVAAVLKALGGVLALALVRPFGARLPRRLLVGLAAAGAVVLVLYGALQTGALALVALDVVRPDVPPDPRVLRWRLLLWEPWFLGWGLLLGAAAWSARRSRSDQ